LALLSVAAVTRESDAERLQRAPGTPVDYLASVDILDPAQIAAIGAELDLAGFAVTPHEIVGRDLVSLPLRASNGALLGYAQWHNAHPGSVAFNRQIGPVVLGVALVGALSILMALVLMRREVAAATQIEGALEASRLKSEFISNMSHELRTPLDAILGYAELIQEEAPRGNLFDGVRRDAANITDSAKQLRQLIDDVLDHSRIDAGRLQLAPEPINVPELFAEIEDALEPRVRAHGTQLSFACEHARLSLTGDHQRLRQCLLNLAENSLQFASNGEVAIAARTARVNEIDCIVFEIKDNGLGVTRAAAATLFEPFTQASNGSARSKRGGTLALSISRKLARAMGGDITFDGAPGGGAHFTLTVPSKSPLMFANAA
jgi:signal transduction histidine kinase